MKPQDLGQCSACQRSFKVPLLFAKSRQGVEGIENDSQYARVNTPGAEVARKVFSLSVWSPEF